MTCFATAISSSTLGPRGPRTRHETERHPARSSEAGGHDLLCHFVWPLHDEQLIPGRQLDLCVGLSVVHGLVVADLIGVDPQTVLVRLRELNDHVRGSIKVDLGAPYGKNGEGTSTERSARSPAPQEHLKRLLCVGDFRVELSFGAENPALTSCA